MSSNTNGLDNYAATLQERKRKEKEAKQKELQKMQEARLGGKSALDCMEDDDDGNVYDLVDDEEYAKIVKSRREESDFVVDDNGIGYADDGEEVVGVIEDAYDAKRRMKEAADEGDSKGAKRARKLAEATAGQLIGQRSMASFVRTGQSTVQRASAARDTAKHANLLDIDALMGSGPAAAASAAPRRPAMGGMPAPVLPRGAARAPVLHRMPVVASRLPQAAAARFTASSSSYGDDAAGYGGGDDFAPDDMGFGGEHDPVVADGVKVEKAEEGAAADVVKPEPASQDDAGYQKINLSKTTKKLTVTAAPVAVPRPAGGFSAASSVALGAARGGPAADDGAFKPVLASMGAGGDGLELQAIGSLGEAPVAAATGTASAGAVDPRMWLQKRVVGADVHEVEADGDDTAASASAGPAKEEEFLHMYWMDAQEINGIIYLFGKVPLRDPATGKLVRYTSCCVAVHGAERNLFVLPRLLPEKFKTDGTPVRAGMAEVFRDVNSVLVPDVIPKSEGQVFRCKPVRRRYAFEHGGVPRGESEYLKVVYQAKRGVPSPKVCQAGTENIERIFGATSSPLELFLLKRKLMGPCWVTIRNPRTLSDPASWCAVEVGVESPKLVVKTAGADCPKEVPPLVTMCLSMKTAVNPATSLHEIVALSAMVHSKVDAEGDPDENPRLMRRFTLVRQLGTTCGSAYTPTFPNNLPAEIKRAGAHAAGLQTFPNERALLSMFFVRIQQEDPDVIASHNLYGFEFDVILARAQANKLPGSAWSKLGRFRRQQVPRGNAQRAVCTGRLMVDTYKNAKDFLRETSYSLTSLAASVLKFNRVEVDPMDVPRFFSSAEDILKIAEHCAVDAMLVQKLMFKLQVVPLTKQLTNVAGNLWSSTIRGGKAERVEYLLLHEFHALKFILPEKKGFEDNKPAHGKRKGGAGAEGDGDEEEDKVGGHSRTRGKAAYAGGLVLEPKKGLYDTYILLLDFNSLYPSIIQEYNLCFTTIEWTKFMGDDKPAAPAAAPASSSSGAKGKGKGSKKAKKAAGADASGAAGAAAAGEEEDGEEEDDEAGDGEDAAAAGGKVLPPLPDSSLAQGVLPRVIRTLVERRKGVKDLLKKANAKQYKDEMEIQQLDIRQKALKLTANSMYGCLGFSFSRFSARPIAALVTAMGREALQRTVDLATNQLGLDVIYGDTDSVMINTNSRDLKLVKEIGNNVKKEVNKLYKALELDLDGVFKSMLLLKKKKYAAVTIKEDGGGNVTYEKELKGLDLVRRDWCPLSKDTGKFVVDQILSGGQREDIVMAVHDHLSELAANVRAGKVDLRQFVVTKGLNKHPKDYPDNKGQAHLIVALEMLKRNIPVNVGDNIPYVICVQGEAGAHPPARARHPDEVERSNGELTLDYEWYLSNQILPPIARLCEPIEGTSSAIISTKLGLDASKYAARSAANDDLFGNEDWGFVPRSLMDDAERFRDCLKLECVCAACKTQGAFPGLLTDKGTSGLNCPACGALFYGRNNAADAYSYLSNRVTLLVRQCVKQYYDCWLICDDQTCGRRTMQQSAMGFACTGDCHGRMAQEYDEAKLHTQLKYLESLFDHKRLLARCRAAQVSSEDGAGPRQQAECLESLPADHKAVHDLLREHMANAVKGSAYNWVRPSLWAAVFGQGRAAAAAAAAMAKGGGKENASSGNGSLTASAK